MSEVVYKTEPAGLQTRVVRVTENNYKPVAIFPLKEDADRYVALMNGECPFCGEEFDDET